MDEICEAPIDPTIVDEMRREREETQRAKAMAEREAMAHEIRSAHDELNASQRRVAELEDQVRTLIRTIAIITNPPPHPPVDYNQLFRSHRAKEATR